MSFLLTIIESHTTRCFGTFLLFGRFTMGGWVNRGEWVGGQLYDFWIWCLVESCLPAWVLVKVKG